MKKLSFFNKFIYLINSLLATLLLLSYLIPYISPKSFPTVAVLGILVPFLILANFLFAIYWIIFLKKQFLLSAIILIIGYFISTPFYKFSSVDDNKPTDIKMMSYNVRMFNHWEWIDDDNIPNKIVDFVNKQNPDILLLQEYYKKDDAKFNYPFEFVKTKKISDKSGLAIFSKYPIINSGSFDFKGTSNNIIFVDILNKKDTIRVYNLHLQSLQINPDQENFGQENSEKLLGRLRDGFTKQAIQTEKFLNQQKKWKGKTIIAGDFNNTSFSWVYNKITKDKKDAFIEAGEGFGKTFNYTFPMRIDFILTDETANITSFTTFENKLSDHFPILTTLNYLVEE